VASARYRWQLGGSVHSSGLSISDTDSGIAEMRLSMMRIMARRMKAAALRA
jgi:hypothetical protein